MEFIYNNSQELQEFLKQKQISYEICQEPKNPPKQNIFANYGEAIKDKPREQEANELENAEKEDIINEDW